MKRVERGGKDKNLSGTARKTSSKVGVEKTKNPIESKEAKAQKKKKKNGSSKQKETQVGKNLNRVQKKKKKKKKNSDDEKRAKNTLGSHKAVTLPVKKKKKKNTEKFRVRKNRTTDIKGNHKQENPPPAERRWKWKKTSSAWRTQNGRGLH